MIYNTSSIMKILDSSKVGTLTHVWKRKSSSPLGYPPYFRSFACINLALIIWKNHGVWELIYTTKISKSVSVYASMYGHAFCRAFRYGAETWHGLRAYFRSKPTQGQRSSPPKVKGHQECCFRNALWPPNLVGRTSDRSVIHIWGQRTCRGKPGVKLFRNPLWLPILVGRNPDRSEVQYSGQRSYRGQPRSTRSQIAQEYPMATKFGRTNPWQQYYNAGVEGHEVKWGSTGGQIA